MERGRFQPRRIHPRSIRLTKCLCAVASERTPIPRQISSSDGAYPCAPIYCRRYRNTAACLFVNVTLHPCRSMRRSPCRSYGNASQCASRRRRRFSSSQQPPARSRVGVVPWSDAVIRSVGLRHVAVLAYAWPPQHRTVFLEIDNLAPGEVALNAVLDRPVVRRLETLSARWKCSSANLGGRTAQMSSRVTIRRDGL
jgi:hypothetical protein